MSETGIYIRVGKEDVLLENLDEIERTLWLQSLSENGLIRTLNRCCDVIEDFIVNYQHLQKENQQLKENYSKLLETSKAYKKLLKTTMQKEHKATKVLDEIREYIKSNISYEKNSDGYGEPYLGGYEIQDLLQILDKVNQN